MARKDERAQEGPPMNIAQAVADLTFAVDKIATPLIKLRDHLAAAGQIEPAARNAERRRDEAQRDLDELDARKVRLADEVAELDRIRAEEQAATDQLCGALRQQRENAQREYDQAVNDLARSLERTRELRDQNHARDLAQREQEIASLEERKAALLADLEVIARRAVLPA